MATNTGSSIALTSLDADGHSISSPQSDSPGHTTSPADLDHGSLDDSPTPADLPARGRVARAIDHCRSQMATFGQKLRAKARDFFNESNWKWKFMCLILMLWGTIVPTYLAIHYDGSANELSQQGLLTSQWANYYTWAYTICPFEEARNMSSIECRQASNKTAPPPRMPALPAKRSIEALLGKRLWPKMNGSAAFQEDINHANEFCSTDQAQTIPGEHYAFCSALVDPWLDREAQLSGRSDHLDELLAPLPPRDYAKAKAKRLKLWKRVVAGYFAFTAPMILCLQWLSPLAIAPTLTKKGAAFMPRAVMLRIPWTGWLAASSLLSTLALVSRVKQVAIWISKDDFITSCSVDQGPDAQACNVLSGLTDGLSVTETINVIAVWHAYISIGIADHVDTVGFVICYFITATAWVLVAYLSMDIYMIYRNPERLDSDIGPFDCEDDSVQEGPRLLEFEDLLEDLMESSKESEFNHSDDIDNTPLLPIDRPERRKKSFKNLPDRK